MSLRRDGKMDVLTSVLFLAQEPYPVLSLHGCGDTVSQKLALWPEFTKDAECIGRGYVEEGRDGWMM